MHSSQDVLLGRLAHGVLLVVGEQDHVLPLVSKVLNQVRGHVANVIDAASQLAALAEVVDANEQGLPAPIALRVLEGIVGGGASAKVLWGGWGWARRMAVIRVRVRCVCVASILLLEGGLCPRGLVPLCSGRRGAAHLDGRTGPGAARCSRTAAAVGAVEHEHGQQWEAM